VEDERPQRRRFRFHLRTLLTVIAFVALLLVNGMLWMRLRTTQAAYAREHAQLRNLEIQFGRDRDALTTIIRELRDLVERSASRAASPGGPVAKTQR
jgi:hypothetical protein